MKSSVKYRYDIAKADYLIEKKIFIGVISAQFGFMTTAFINGHGYTQGISLFSLLIVMMKLLDTLKARSRMKRLQDELIIEHVLDT